MSFLNENLPPVNCLVRNEFLYNQESGFGETTPCWIIGVRSVQGQALQFYALLENGALFTGLPIHAFCHTKEAIKPELGVSQLWDSLSYDISVIEFRFLRMMDCTVLLKDKSIQYATYLFSIDFCHASSSKTGLAETPAEWKILHFLKLEDGNFALYPQNRIQFRDAGMLSPDDLSEVGYKINTTNWVAEDGNKWLTPKQD